jgi:hypothetical protein
VNAADPQENDGYRSSRNGQGRTGDGIVLKYKIIQGYSFIKNRLFRIDQDEESINHIRIGFCAHIFDFIILFSFIKQQI